MSDTLTQSGSYLTRLPFKSGDGVTRYCVEGAMTDDASADGVYAVPTPDGQTAPTYCVDCMGDLGCGELVYGAGAQKCMQCGSVFLRR
jgi:hypothetical protein